jgi:hypothetical protein
MCTNSSQLQLLHLDWHCAMCFVLRLRMPLAAFSTAWQAPPLALLVCCLVVTSCLCLLVGGLFDGLEGSFVCWCSRAVTDVCKFAALLCCWDGVSCCLCTAYRVLDRQLLPCSMFACCLQECHASLLQPTAHMSRLLQQSFDVLSCVAMHNQVRGLSHATRSRTALAALITTDPEQEDLQWY